jgi:spectinomycin phosphotransferase
MSFHNPKYATRPPQVPNTLYGFDVAELTFLPLGFDAAAWAYRVQVIGGERYFLKVRLTGAAEAALLVPRYLQDRGIAGVVAPLPTATGAFAASVPGYTLVLYPFVVGGSGRERGLTARQWVDYGALLRRVHDTPLTAELAARLPHEPFVPNGAASVRRLDTYLDGGATKPPLVLCHADIHTSNVLVDDAGRVWFVDWDGAMLAPRERDLMFALGGGISRELVRLEAEVLFRRRYQGEHAVPVDPLGLAYYRYAWAVSDIGAFGEEVCCRPDLGALSRQVALDAFRGLFLPGAIVDLARGADFPDA